MRKLIVLTLLISQVIVAQKKITSESLKIEDITIQKEVLKQAVKYNDGVTAINSLHKIIVLEGKTSTYKDSLAIIYFKINNFSSSYLVSQEVLEKKPNDLTMLAINAESLKNLGDNKKAISVFETLFGLSKNQYHGYQLANLQLELKRLNEAKETIDQILLCEEIKDLVIQFPFDNENVQNVPIKAAIYNLKGIIFYELKENDLAKKAFQDAINIYPNFVVAKQNIKFDTN
jgi:tetratricopeptide (TPR) repeat protein